MNVPAGSRRSDNASRSKLWKKGNQPPDGPWVWLSREMLASQAWVGMSSMARAVVDRLILEHMAHAGTQNGELIVTKRDFSRYGIREGSVPAAVREAEALGWIATTQKGRGGNSDFRKASRYAIEWLPRSDGSLASNRWRRFQTKDEVVAAIKAARPTSDRQEQAA